jgi:hypothetical protein
MTIHNLGAWLFGLGSWLAVASVAIGQAPPPVAGGRTLPGMQGVPGATAVDPAVTKPMTLTEAQLNSFFAAMDDFDALSKQTAKSSKADPSKPAEFAGALATSAEAQEILRKHGFSDPVEFQRIAYNAAMAYGVLEQGGKQALQEKLNRAKAQHEKAMQQMKQHLSPEQLEAMQGHMSAGMAMVGSMSEVPEENLVLMEKYRDRMEKLVKQ